MIAAILASLLPLPLKADGQHLALIVRPPLAPDLAALPRVAGNDTFVQKINAVLAAEDAKAIEARNDCLEEPNADFSSWADVTLNGPYFLGIQYGQSYYCNTGHPWTDRWVLLFDLKSGESIDPVSLLPNALRPLPEDENPATWSEEKALAGVKPLTDLYLSLWAHDPANNPDTNELDCTDVLTHDTHSFLIWPDAKAHALMLMPYSMAYIDTPCQNPVAVPVALLLKLNASPRLIIALSR